VQAKERLELLKEPISEIKSQEHRIAVPVSDGFHFVVIKNILKIVSGYSYSRIFFVDGKSLLVSKPLTEFEDLLTPYRFFRVSNSHLINLNYINMYLHGAGVQVLMDNGDIIDVSKRENDEFIRLLNV